MTVRCELCGYENTDTYRFCGMCGAALRHPEPARDTVRQSPRPEPPREKPLPVTGPSFLGLSQEPEKAGVEYLLEDEESGGHWGALVLVLVLAAAAVSAWYWRASYMPYLAKVMPQVSNAPVNGVPTQGNASAPTVPSVGSGTTTSPEPSQPLAPSPSTSPQNSQAPPPLTGDESHMVQTERQPVPSPQESPAPQADASNAQPAPSQSAPAAAGKQSSSAAKAAENSDEAADTAENDSEAENEEPTPAAAPAPTRKTRPSPADKASAVSTPPESADDRLVADGRKYLYGDGVPENCDRARRNLTTAAGSNNPQAQSILGTMYATGHCVTRNLPTAYRWFARALHTEPGNDRVKQDLEVLWRQMSTDERQIAMRSQ